MDVEVRHLCKTHRRGDVELAVLRDVSFTIASGEFTVIVGPSGSGKSTLLYLLGALDQPTSGEIFLDGRDLSKMTPQAADRLRREEIGFVFQSFNLLSNLSAVDNVLVPYMPVGQAPSRRPDAVKLLERIGLGGRLDHRPAQLSGGEQQRVAIARALLKKPRLVLADEPTGELDSVRGGEIFQQLRDLRAETAATIVVVTHDDRYLRPGDRILEIADGAIQSSHSEGSRKS